MNLKIKWNSKSYQEFIEYLHSIKDENYKTFNSKIISTKYPMLGIRLPILRKFAKEICKGDYKLFLECTSHTYYEEVMITLFVIASIKDKNEFIEYFYSYIDLIDNWALCDSLCASMKLVIDHKQEFLEIIKSLVNSSKTYYIRIGLVLLLDYYVDAEYLKIIFKILNNLNSEEYYVSMASAWLLCEVFIKYPCDGKKFLQTNNLNSFTVNKAISKIRDSYRVDNATKKEILKYKK